MSVRKVKFYRCSQCDKDWLKADMEGAICRWCSLRKRFSGWLSAREKKLEADR